MSLVIGFSGVRGAIVGGDLREILLWGDDSRVRVLEEELYTGEIISDQQLEQRAADLGVSLSIRDNKVKIREQGGVLIGEVSESDGGVVRKRRLYLVAGEYAIANIEDDYFHLRSRASNNCFVVLGNEVTKRIANEAISANWKNGTFEEAVKVIIIAMGLAASRTASVSKKYLLLQTKEKSELSGIIEKDRQETEKGGG
jgi:hypothetical protein